MPGKLKNKAPTLFPRKSGYCGQYAKRLFAPVSGKLGTFLLMLSITLKTESDANVEVLVMLVRDTTVELAVIPNNPISACVSVYNNECQHSIMTRY